jgi:hypothetical protein
MAHSSVAVTTVDGSSATRKLSCSYVEEVIEANRRGTWSINAVSETGVHRALMLQLRIPKGVSGRARPVPQAQIDKGLVRPLRYRRRVRLTQLVVWLPVHAQCNPLPGATYMPPQGPSKPWCYRQLGNLI